MMPAQIVHPSRILSREMIEQNLTAEDLADRTYQSVAYWGARMNGEVRFDTVLDTGFLAMVLGVREAFWEALWANYDKAVKERIERDG